MRLDYRITGLLSIFKREFDESHDKAATEETLTIGEKGAFICDIKRCKYLFLSVTYI